MSVFLKKLAILAAAAAALAASVTVAAAQSRTALVVGQGGYAGAPVRTAVNDAGLVAQALTGAGFEVIQGRDLGASDLRRIVRDFLDKVEAGGPDGEVMVYLSGHGVQLEGENYLLPVDARIVRDSDIPIEGLRLSDVMRSLAAAPGRVRIVVADLAHDYPLPAGAQGIAPGLALVDPLPGFLVAFSSAPNIPVPESKEPYGAYAPALVEMMREPGLPLEEVFSRARLRTHQVTDGQQVPWHVSDVKTDFTFLQIDTSVAVAAAPAPRQPRRIAEVAPDEGYSLAVERDTIEDYQEFLRRHPDHRESRRIAALLAARREAVVWRKTVSRDTPNAYWTYLRQYPRGPHAPDARRRLARLQAQLAPPVVFEEIIYEDLPPPLPFVRTIEVIEVVTIIRRLPPPPPVPIFILPPRDDIIVVIISRPPPPPILIGILPIPVAIPIPVHARAPRWYQPIAPITPRGPVLIPVAAPERLSREEFRERRERNRDRPLAPLLPRETTVPNQPGLAAPIVPIAARPPEGERTRGDRDRDRRNGDRDGNRDRREQDRGPRLPLQPIPLGERPENVQLPGAAQPRLPGAAVGRQDGANPGVQNRDRREGRGEQPAATLPGVQPEPGSRAVEREQRQGEGADRRETRTPAVGGVPLPDRLGREGQQREDRRAVEEQGRERRQGAEGEQGRTPGEQRRAVEEQLRRLGRPGEGQGRPAEDQQRRAVEEQLRQQQRRAGEEQDGERRRTLEQQQRRVGEEQEREQRRGVEQQQQRRAAEEQEREQRRGVEQQQHRRAAEEQERQQRRAIEQQQQRAAEQLQLRRATEEQERQQRRAIEQQQQRAAEQLQQRRAAEEQERQQRRAIEQQQQRVIEQQQQRRAAEEQERQQRRAIEQQQQRALEQQQQRRAIEQQQQRRAAEEQERQQRRAIEQQQQQRRAAEEQERQQRRAIEQQQRAVEQQRGGGDGERRRGDGGGGGRKMIECQLRGRC